MKLIFALLRAPVALAALLSALVVPTAWAHDGQQVVDRQVQVVALSGVSTVTVSGPGFDGTRAAALCTTMPSTWATPVTGSRWIGSQADCTNLPAGDFTFSTSFTLPADLSPLQNLRLDGTVAADDTVTVQLNGHTVFSGGFWATTTDFSTADRSFFTAGANTLTFVAHNNGAGSGVDFRAAVTATNANGTVIVRANDDDRDDDHDADDDHDNHGACVSAAAHKASKGPGHGAAVSAAAHSCGH